MTNVAVLISGYGSNLQAIIDAAESGQLRDTRVSVVVSDHADAFGLERAQRHGIPAVHYPYPSRSLGRPARLRADQELATLLQRYQAEWVVLAGWLRLLSSAFLTRFPSRVVNIHPALPGQFPGLHAIERAFTAYRAGRIRETGVMVHLVLDEGVDTGPIIAVERVPIASDETLETLTERTHAVEHRLIVQTLSALLSQQALSSTMTLNFQKSQEELYHCSNSYDNEDSTQAKCATE